MLLITHIHVLANKIHKAYNLEFPINILNIGGISNVTTTVNENDLDHISKKIIEVVKEKTGATIRS